LIEVFRFTQKSRLRKERRRKRETLMLELELERASGVEARKGFDEPGPARELDDNVEGRKTDIIITRDRLISGTSRSSLDSCYL
jgi:hypothetical protein